MFYTKIKDLSIAYRKEGSGSALVLLHGGLNCNCKVWRTQIEGLSNDFTIIAWDAPGTGKSDDTPEFFTLKDWADCLAELLDTIGIKKAYILGLSWGGLLAQMFYEYHSSRVQSLILCGAYTGWKGSLTDSEFKTRTTNALADASLPPKEIARKYLPSMFSDNAPVSLRGELLNIISTDFRPNGFRAMVKAMATDSRELLPKIKVPTLLIWGDSDKRSSMDVALAFKNSIPGARLEIISNAGHISNMENPDEFNKAVKDFCLSVVSKE